MTIVHLTLTGPDAGRPLCDCNKQEALERGEEFYHFVYAPKSVLDSPDLCPRCKEVLYSPEDDSDEYEYPFSPFYPVKKVSKK